jgi:hypothetical protein
VNEVSQSCHSCTGWFCVAKGRKKKVGDTTICNNEELWRECVRYLQVYPAPEPELDDIDDALLGDETLEEPIFTPTADFNYLAPIDETMEDEIVDTPPPPPKKPRTTCPYLGPPPKGVRTCCGYYCYADDVAVRTATQCTSRPSWLECVVRLRAVRRGK